MCRCNSVFYRRPPYITLQPPFVVRIRDKRFKRYYCCIKVRYLTYLTYFIGSNGDKVLQDKVLYFEFHMLLHALDVGNSLIPEKNWDDLGFAWYESKLQITSLVPKFRSDHLKSGK